MSSAAIAIIGMGPRGVIALERIAALANSPHPPAPLDGEVTLHLIDPEAFGPGRVWATDQSRLLVMNTLAGAVTVFTDPTVIGSGRIVPGPTLFEWALIVGDREEAAQIPAARRQPLDEVPVREGLREAYRAELASLTVDAHPPRSLYGEYLAWAYSWVLRQLPARIRVFEHHATATAVEDAAFGPLEIASSKLAVELDNGEWLLADSVIASLGWTPQPADDQPAPGSGLVYVDAESPIHQDLSQIRPHEPVIARGLGMGFFDTVTLLTQGRGGRFEAGEYVPSGQEPEIWATSRRGAPLLAKSTYGALPPAPKNRRLREFLRSRPGGVVDVAHSVLPLIEADAAEAYWRTLARVRPELVPDIESVVTAIDVGEPVARLVSPEAPPFDLSRIAQPFAGTRFWHAEEFDEAVTALIADDLAQARLGLDSPLKAALWEINGARKPVSLLAEFGGITPESVSALAEFEALGQTVGSGPPAFRTEELLALMRAGIVHLLGPNGQVRIDETPSGPRYVASSPQVHGAEVRSRVLLEARMRNPDVRTTTDPLIAGLRLSGRVRPFSFGEGEARVETPAIDIDPTTGRAVRRDGRVDERIHFGGVPLAGARGDVTISPMPRANATMLREMAGIVRAALRTAAIASGSDRKKGNRR